MSADNERLKVPPGELYKSRTFSRLDFRKSDELEQSTIGVGQQRAADAIRFGVQTQSEGYNVFVMGPAGSHRHGLARDLLEKQAGTQPVPDDWCFVNNFSDPDCPRALSFPAGRGAEFRSDMESLIEEMQIAIPAAFEADDYRSQVKAIEEDTENEARELWQSLDELAAREGIGVLPTPTGYVLAPVRDGKVIGEKEFEKLGESEQQQIKAATESLGKELQLRIERMAELRKKQRERVKTLNQEVTAHAVGLLLTDLKHRYEALPEVVEYLGEVQQNITENADRFLEPDSPSLPFLPRSPSRLFGQYAVNLVANNSGASAAPVIYESNPSYSNVIGNVEHRVEMGALITDFSMVRSGALLRANGGYLVLDIEHMLRRPFVWDALKRALLEQQLRIESPEAMVGLGATTTLRPEAIPLRIKIVLIGERWLYYLLSAYDSEFDELFRVVADIDDEIDRSESNVDQYALLAATRIRDRELLPFSRAAMQRVAEESARVAEDGEKLSLHMRSLDDLLVQSDFWARRAVSEHVEAEHIDIAIAQRVNRLNRVHLKIVESIERHTLLVDTTGAAIGQVNGLSVITLGGYRFGHPMRITATTRIGSGDVVDIEREVELGGAIHSKGVMILSSALASRYAPDTPLSMHGSIVFEQSYGGVEGDSASVAELCALLSSLSRVPILQNLAVTGSVNQLGQVQAIGGVNEKIEGFFAVCKARGLDGSHGVVIPRDNVKHLMLRKDVIAAVEEGLFHVYAVSRIDEAIELLTGVDAGERDEHGAFPEGTVNHAVERQLVDYANKRQDFGNRAAKDDAA